MKVRYLLFLIFSGCLFFACKPNFDLNSPYKDVPVVYGILDYKDSIHYVKIYKGYQPKQGMALIDAQNPDSIYYYDNIKVVLEEYDVNDKRTSRPDIPLYITYDFPRDSGIFYYEKERILYYTNEHLNKDKVYNIKITNKLNDNEIQGKTSIVGDFEIKLSAQFNMTAKTSAVSITSAQNASEFGYEIHVNFLYFEVDAIGKDIIKIGKISKNICPKLGEKFSVNFFGELYKVFAPTFYDDIAAQLEVKPNVIRYAGMPNSNGTCIEIEAWAADENLVKFLLSNQPSSSFVQINNLYSNLLPMNQLLDLLLQE